MLEKVLRKIPSVTKKIINSLASGIRTKQYASIQSTEFPLFWFHSRKMFSTDAAGTITNEINDFKDKNSSYDKSKQQIQQPNSIITARLHWLVIQNLKEWFFELHPISMTKSSLNTPFKILKGPQSRVNSLMINRDGTILVATTLNDKVIYLWNILSDETARKINIDIVPEASSKVACNNDGNLLAVANSSNKFSKIKIIKVNDANTIGIDLHDENGNPSFIYTFSSLAFDPQSFCLVATSQLGNDRGQLFYWEISKVKEGQVNKPTKIYDLGDIKLPVDIVFDSTGNKLAGGNEWTPVYDEGLGYPGFLFDFATKKQTTLRLSAKSSFNRCVAFSSDNQFLVTGGRHRINNKSLAAVHLWDMNGKLINSENLKKPSSTFLGRENLCTDLAFFIDNNTIISADDQGYVRVCDRYDNPIAGKEIGNYGKVMGFFSQNKNISKAITKNNDHDELSNNNEKLFK